MPKLMHSVRDKDVPWLFTVYFAVIYSNFTSIFMVNRVELGDPLASPWVFSTFVSLIENSVERFYRRCTFTVSFGVGLSNFRHCVSNRVSYVVVS